MPATTSNLTLLRSKLLLRGWKLGVFLNALCVAVVLAVNLGTTIWAISTSTGVADGSRRRLYEGSCSRVKVINLAGHVLINALSTILLSASNYCMQCLSAPNRGEVDRAHAKRKWLDLGTPSLRNLGSIAPARVLLWLLIAVSSLPLHLFYNSALFSSFSASEYAVLTVVEQFTQPSAGPDPWGGQDSAIADSLHEKALSGRLDRLDNLDCITKYAQPFQSSRANLVVVLDAQPGDFPSISGSVVDHYIADYSFLHSCGVGQAFYWLCSEHFTIAATRLNPETAPGCSNPCEEQIPELQANAHNWTAFRRRVKYCLSEPAPDRCRLYFNSTIATVVNVINAVKLIAILLAFSAIRESPLMTLGDAIRSFTETPDKTTQGLGLVTRADFVSCPAWQWPAKRSQYNATRKRWFIAVGRLRIAFAVLLYLILLGVCALLLAWGVTSMAMAAEWDRFALQRKGLRLSSPPSGAQRSSHLLQLPYKFIAPLIVLSGLLHWMASQSIFLVDVEREVAPGVDLPPGFSTTCGYSPLAIICFICLGLLMVFSLLGTSARRFRTGMPVAGNCSAAISAACHQIPEDIPGVSRFPLQWGEVLVQNTNYVQEGDGRLERRCGFSCEAVRLPVPWESYA